MTNVKVLGLPMNNFAYQILLKIVSAKLYIRFSLILTYIFMDNVNVFQMHLNIFGLTA